MANVIMLHNVLTASGEDSAGRALNAACRTQVAMNPLSSTAMLAQNQRTCQKRYAAQRWQWRVYGRHVVAQRLR